MLQVAEPKCAFRHSKAMTNDRQGREMKSIGAAMEADAVGDQRHRGLQIAVLIFTALATVTFGVMYGELKRDYPGPTSFREGQILSPVLAIELAGTRTDLEKVLHAGEPDEKQASDALKKNTKQDCFFIVCYTGVLVSLALLFTVGPQARQLRWSAVVTAALAGVFDYAEDFGIFRAIAEQSAGPGHLTDDLARHISYPSLEKWTTLGITLLILAPAAWRSQLPGQRSKANLILTICFGVGGLLLLTAIQSVPLFPFANLWFAGTLLLAAVHILLTLVRHRSGGVPGRSVQ
jgi:hypothetical protein